MLRSLLGVKLRDKIRLGEIYSKTRARQVGVITRTLKFKYAGHMYRDVSQKWIESLPHGSLT